MKVSQDSFYLLLFAGLNGINDAGQVVGFSDIGAGFYAAEWSGGSVINLGGVPGSILAKH